MEETRASFHDLGRDCDTVRRKVEQKHGSCRTKDTVLAIYDVVQDSIRTGRPDRTLLDPPPGPPADELAGCHAVTRWRADARLATGDSVPDSPALTLMLSPWQESARRLERARNAAKGGHHVTGDLCDYRGRDCRNPPLR